MNNDRIEQIKHDPATLRVYTSRLKFRKNGQFYEANCPFHADSNPSFQVYEKAGIWMWTCQSKCGSGNVIQFVEKLERIPFAAALKKVEDELGSSWNSKKQAVEETFREFGNNKEEKITYSLAEYTKLENILMQNSFAKDWLLKERGISFSTAQKLHFGYRQDVGKLAGDKSDIANKGWIAIPCIQNDRIVSIEYRSLFCKAFLRQPGMGNSLFNLNSIDLLEPIYVTEGKFDAAVLEQAGFRAISLPNATAKLTPEMKDQLKQADSIILAGDTDSAGAAAMEKLWAELGERTYLLHWPVGCKDANEVFLKQCDRDINKFRDLVARLTETAKGNPLPNVVSLQEAMLSTNRTNLADHPNRLRFPWPAVDRMAILLPGSVMALSATNTKMGKTVFQTNLTVYGARKHGEVVLNYQCELSTDEFSNMVAAHVLRKSRNHLTPEDYKQAAALIGNCRFYIGRNPTFTTVNQVLDLIEAAVQRLGATIVVLDHLHFICRNEDNEVYAQANAMQRIKNMAVRYGLKFIVVGQPRKAEQTKKGKNIHVTDFKGSETFGSDSDAIFAIHRGYIKIKDPNNPPKDDYDPKTEVHMLGARAKGDGATYAELIFLGDLASFESISYESPPAQTQLAM